MLCYSALSTQHSALSTQHSALSTQHSALSTQHSALSNSNLLSFHLTLFPRLFRYLSLIVIFLSCIPLSYAALSAKTVKTTEGNKPYLKYHGNNTAHYCPDAKSLLGISMPRCPDEMAKVDLITSNQVQIQ